MIARRRTFLTLASIWYLEHPIACLVIEPGIGLVGKDGAERLVVFEHTPRGTGALVYNQPTPVKLSDLGIPRFSVFGGNTLMLGCGMKTSQGGSNLAIGDMSPWFWLHNVESLPGSFHLPAANGPLFMGGNIEEASLLVEKGEVDPARFKFFYKYKSWKSDDLLKEIERGLFEVAPQDVQEALRPYSMSL